MIKFDLSEANELFIKVDPSEGDDLSSKLVLNFFGDINNRNLLAFRDRDSKDQYIIVPKQLAIDHNFLVELPDEEDQTSICDALLCDSPIKEFFEKIIEETTKVATIEREKGELTLMYENKTKTLILTLNKQTIEIPGSYLLELNHHLNSVFKI